MTPLQIAAQVIAVIIIVIMAIGSQAKTQRSFLFFQLIINALYCVHYAFLSATAATVVCIICVLRTLIFYLYRRKDKTVPIWMLIIILVVVVGSGAITWDGWLSLLPIVGTILFTLGQWQSNLKITRMFVIGADLVWIGYNIFYLAYADIAGRAVEALSCVIAALRYRGNTEKQASEVSVNISPIKEVKFYNLDEVTEDQLKIAVVAIKFQNKWIFYKNKESATWELLNDYKKETETILDTAKRDLIEKTGTDQFEITPICSYYVTKHAMLFYAELKGSDNALKNAIKAGNLSLVKEIPSELTLPNIHPKLFEKAKEFINSSTSH